MQSNNLHRRYLQRLDQQVDSLQARNREKEHSAQEACNALARKNGSVIGPIRMDGNYRNRGVCIG